MTSADFHALMELAVHGFEVAGVLVLVLGAMLAFASALVTARRGGPTEAHERVRRDIGRAILLGLELLIIADIVLTITVDTTLRSAVALGLIVVVRTFLSFSLEVELDGALPWRRSDGSPSQASHRST
jgi:uncharacterized membrane protein